MASDDSASSHEDKKEKKQRKKAKKAKKQKKQKKAKRERLTAHAALDLTPAGEPAPAPAPVAETLDDRVRLLAARGASDAEIGRLLREAAGAGAGSPAGVRSRAAWAVSRCFFVLFAFFCFFLAFFAAFRSFRSFSSADDADSSSDGIALGQ